MSPKDIRKGMICTDGKGFQFVMLSLATSFLNSEGERIHIDNRRQNKWWVKRCDGGLTETQPDCRMEKDSQAVMACFDQEWDNEKCYHFKQPA